MTGYNIREGSIILAERFALLDKRRTDPLGSPLVEQVAPPDAPRRQRELPSPRPAPKKKAA